MIKSFEERAAEIADKYCPGQNHDCWRDIIRAFEQVADEAKQERIFVPIISDPNLQKDERYFVDYSKLNTPLIEWPSEKAWMEELEKEALTHLPEEFVSTPNLWRIALYRMQYLVKHITRNDEKLVTAIQEAREALKFYGDQEMYMQECDVGDITEWELDCYGTKAREALKRIEELLG